MINMTELIGAILTSAIRNLFAHQPNVLEHTSWTGMTEWNFGHHLSNEIAKYIFWLNHDMDVVKRNYNNRRPDIIFHKREINELNYLVIEIKRGNSSYVNRQELEIEYDVKKIQNDWMGADLHYSFGSLIVVNSKSDFEVIVFNKDPSGEYLSEKFSPPSPYIEVPQISESKKLAFKAIVDQILAAKRKNPNADTTALKRELDQMVRKLYGLREEEIKTVKGEN